MTGRTREQALDKSLRDALVTQAPFSIALYDLDGRIVFANAAFERHFGVQRSDIPADYSLFTDRQLEDGGLIDLIRQAYAGNAVTLPAVRYDAAAATGGVGRTSWTQGHCYPVRSGDGSVASVAIVHTDVTDRIEAELALADARDAALAERERVNRIVSQLPAPIVVLEGSELRVRAMSDAYRQIIGGRDVGDRPLREVLPELSSGNNGADFHALMERVYATGEVIRGSGIPSAWDDDDDGVPEDHYIDFVYAPLRGAGNDASVTGVTALVLDVSARAHAEAALRESEARFRNMADAAPVMLWVTEPDGSCSFLNHAWLEFTGQSLEQGLGYGWLDAVHPDDRPRAERDFREANARRTPFRADYRLRRHDGVYRWAVDASSPRIGPGGEFLGYIGSVLDVDERTQLLEAERAARVAAEEAHTSAEQLRSRAESSESMARQLFELSPIPKWVYDAETLRYLDVNEAAIRHYGYSREEFLSMTIRDIRPPEDIPLMIRFAQSPHPIAASQGVFRHRKRSGEIMHVEVFLRDMQYEGRRAVIAALQDVTEHRRAEAALLETSRMADLARDAAESANAAKSQFLSTMSHELRTPLHAIGGYTELLAMGLRGEVNEAQRHDLDRIRLASQHLMSLVTDVLNFARLDAGRLEYNVTDVDVAAVIGELEPLIGPQLAAKRVVFEHGVGASGSPEQRHVVRADPEKLRQILLNLLGNAVKFTDAGGRVSIVSVADESANVVRLRVSDSGRGIDADDFERIFEPFVQVDRHRLPESQQGVGLGLAISRQLARAMGGDIAVESTRGAGSTFTLTLPRG